METIKQLLSELEKKPSNTRLAKVLQQILHVIKKIKNCDSYRETKIYFDTLQEIQEILSFLFFNNKISLSPELRKFVRDCDRLDDEWLREHLFEKIKTGTYSLSSDF